jgi:hypothetical protein
MPDDGFLAVCIRPECEWVALDSRGDPITDSQLGALRRIDAHLHADHGERARTARNADPAELPAVAVA